MELARVTIKVRAIPEVGTDGELMRLMDEAEGLLNSIDYSTLLIQVLFDDYPELKDKFEIRVEGA